MSLCFRGRPPGCAAPGPRHRPHDPRTAHRSHHPAERHHARHHLRRFGRIPARTAPRRTPPRDFLRLLPPPAARRAHSGGRRGAARRARARCADPHGRDGDRPQEPRVGAQPPDRAHRLERRHREHGRPRDGAQGSGQRRGGRQEDFGHLHRLGRTAHRPRPGRPLQHHHAQRPAHRLAQPRQQAHSARHIPRLGRPQHHREQGLRGDLLRRLLGCPHRHRDEGPERRELLHGGLLGRRTLQHAGTLLLPHGPPLALHAPGSTRGR